MNVIGNVNLGDLISFRTHSDGILGTNFTNCRIVALLDADDARQHINVDSYHLGVYPYLPQGTPNNPSEYMFAKIKFADGKTTAVGLPWINVDSITKIESRELTLKFKTTSDADLDGILKVLRSNNIPFERV